MTSDVPKASDQIRFGFGKNWLDFLATIDEPRIAHASKSFRVVLGDRDLSGRNMLDVGCGSGLLSLVAQRMGMRVHAFDYDADSVACTIELKRRFGAQDPNWAIERGDVLDEEYMRRCGTFDVVYSWGVIHHTGDMWRALGNVADCVASGGLLFIAIYNDQGGTSRRWRSIKRFYHKLPRALRPLLVASCVPVLWWKDILKGTLLGRPLAAWHNYASERGMSPWYDMVDWVGGYPFQVAKPEEIFDFLHARGFSLERLKTVGGGLGCNELVFRRS